jgi:hypothetical protein
MAPVLLVLGTLLLQVSCAGTIPQTPVRAPEGQVQDLGSGDWDKNGAAGDNLEHAPPENLYFMPASMPALKAAPGVGAITRESRDRASSLSPGEKAALTKSFQDAYADALLRGQPLTGVLGGDLVHSWPETNPSGWVQNWQTADPQPNSWGIPSIILAIQSIEILREMAQDRVFTVHGAALDFYGRSSGMNGANGDRGYGSPRGEEFFYNSNIAQRFELGLIVTPGSGKGFFLPGPPPSDGLEAPQETGVFAPVPKGYSGKIRNAFLTAWKMALDRNIEVMIPDGPGIYLPFPNDPAAPEGGALEGHYVQTFNKQTSLLVLPDTPALPLHARFITSPFLDVLLLPGEYPLRGGEGLEPLDIAYTGDDAFIRRLVDGFALYGFPLSDPLPFKTKDAAPSSWQEAQRFFRGWIIADLEKRD